MVFLRREYIELQKNFLKKIPKSVAIIMDGNGRWAEKRGLPRIEGHRRGQKNVRMVIKTSRELGIKYLTLFAFSTENWKRPKEEVEGLFKLLEEAIEKETEEIHRNKIKIKFIGKIEELPENLKKKINYAEEKTKGNKKMVLNIALNYGGKQEILNAVNKIIKEEIKENIDEKFFSKYLYTKDTPYPDLLIRTGGEKRISNFLLFQIAYTELYFTKTLWPDFKKKDFLKAICEYQNRKRKFGNLISI
jgi:undecaprenyl diphosphate synthase